MARKLLHGFNISLEEKLEVEKLFEADKQAETGSDFDLLHNEVVDDKKAEELSSSSADNTDATDDETNTGDENDTDTETVDGETTDTEESSTEGNSDEETVAQESFRNLIYTEIATEDFGDSYETDQSLVSRIGGKVSEAFKSSVKYLGYLGITYGPTIARNVYKGVVMIMGKLVNLLLSSIVTLTKYLNRRINSFNKLKSDIEDAKKVLKELEGKELPDLTDIKFNNVKVINNLKVSDNVNFIENVSKTNVFIAKTINEINTCINNDIGGVKHLITSSMSGVVKNPLHILKPELPLNDMSSGILNGYEPKDETVDGYISKYSLPGDVSLVAHLPKKDINIMEETIRAYNNSSIFLALNIKNFKSIESVDYMTIDDLNKYLNELTKLCNTCILHQTLYETVIKNKSSLRYNFKHYFNELLNSNKKVSVNDSLIEYVYLKYMFTDKVYLAAAMDIHDYSIKVINNSLSFIKSNIKQFI